MDHRTQRISESIREEIAEIIGYELSDPRLVGVIVTDVHISPDKRKALIRVGVLGAADSKPAMEALEKAKGFVRNELAARLDMFRIPDIYFELDTAAMLGGRLENLMKRIKKGRPRSVEDDSEKKAAE